jgi:hypothetical protein
MTVLSGGWKDCGGCRPRELGDWGSLGGVRLAAAGKRKDRGDGGDLGDAGRDAQTHGHRVDEGAVRAGLRPPWYRSRSRSLLTCMPNRRHGRGRRASGAGQAGWRWLPGRCSAVSWCSTSDARGIFWINVPPGLAAAIALGRLLPRARQQRSRHQIDALGQVLFVIGPRVSPTARSKGTRPAGDRQLSPARSLSPCWRWAASPSRGGTCRCGTTAPLAA